MGSGDGVVVKKGEGEIEGDVNKVIEAAAVG